MFELPAISVQFSALPNLSPSLGSDVGSPAWLPSCFASFAKLLKQNWGVEKTSHFIFGRLNTIVNSYIRVNIIGSLEKIQRRF